MHGTALLLHPRFSQSLAPSYFGTVFFHTFFVVMEYALLFPLEDQSCWVSGFLKVQPQLRSRVLKQVLPKMRSLALQECMTLF